MNRVQVKLHEDDLLPLAEEEAAVEQADSSGAALAESEIAAPEQPQEPVIPIEETQDEEEETELPWAFLTILFYKTVHIYALLTYDFS